MPIALATLLSFILAPLGTRLERWKLGRIPSVLIIVSLAFALILGIGWIVGNQLVHLSAGYLAIKKR